MVNPKPFPPIMVWTWPDTLPGLIIGSARSVTTGTLQGRRQKEVTGTTKVERSPRANVLTTVTCIVSLLYGEVEI